ncbi:tagatose-6-phosphate ketose/aldose isomerase [Larkinella arboricola]|uniref:Tagatose-6-phosphate ketose/aldose isomerase n=1 Tax=Larkinella arboricola TaxID=643671 RepID=A0A327WHP5_LARAB|nr:SIS domain-containing protein [Larkinella arboricola]RAJ90695.1 tagatose-6-phosphate ketose/aldose isomerase [Larkinella arboricola]
MRYLQLDERELERKGGLFTAIEIEGQPVLWQKIFELIRNRREDIGAFLNPLLNVPDLRIILAGAGSSAFIGEAAQGLVQESTGKLTHAIATTDLITHPKLHFRRGIPTLMISFSRSGNSPESLAAVEIADEYCDQIHHLIITCNKDSDLTHRKRPNAFYLVLPEQANDQSLAMTGSFTGMLLAVLLVVKLRSLDTLQDSLETLVDQTRYLLVELLPRIISLASQPYRRIIFLGSGPLLGIARECHLKVQELSDGQVICKHDSFLGFRHGPRAVVNRESLIVYLFSADPVVGLYERDLSLSIDQDGQRVPTATWNMPQVQKLDNSVLDITLSHYHDGPNELSFIGAAVVGQLIGFYQSLYLGLMPDNPSVSGAINRVVQGVTIYPEILQG